MLYSKLIQYTWFICLLCSLIACAPEETITPEPNTGNGSNNTVNPPGPSITHADLIAGHTQFALNFYRATVDETENQFFSPYSIATLLSMLYAASDGNTAHQMEQVMNWGANTAANHALRFSLDGNIQQNMTASRYHSFPSDDKFVATNRVWKDQAVPFLADYEDLLKDAYQADLVDANFQQASVVRQEVNDWVEEKTNNILRDFLPPNFISPAMKTIWINAIYMQVKWDNNFHALTQQATFTTSSGQQQQVDMIQDDQLSGYGLKYLENQTVTALEILFGNRSSIVLMQPTNSQEGLNSFVQQYLNATQWTTWQDELDAFTPPNKPFDVTIPKWEITGTYNLRTTLSQLGIEDLFAPHACNLSRASSTSLFIEKMIHQAKIKVDEEGVAAVAATGASGVSTGSFPIAKYIVFDRPFVFIIKDRDRSILFMGHVQDPS